MRLAGGPEQIGAQMKRVDAAVRRNVPALRQAGNRPRGLWVEPRQSFKQAHDNAEFRDAGDDGGVKRFRLGVVDDGDVGGRFVADATGCQPAKAGGKQTANQLPPQRATVQPSACRHLTSDRGAFQDCSLIGVRHCRRACRQECSARRENCWLPPELLALCGRRRHASRRLRLLHFGLGLTHGIFKRGACYPDSRSAPQIRESRPSQKKCPPPIW